MVGAVGSAAPWFLTVWAVDFMIDMGSQVTIPETSVSDPRVRRASADSSLLTVRGELDMICFSGLEL